MSRHYFLRLSLRNLLRNKRATLPFLLACSLSIAMFCVLHMIAYHPGIDDIGGGAYVRMLMTFGVYVIGIFSAALLFYTNSYLIKRRKMEFGLYAILGMNKRHIARMLLYETCFHAASSLLVGISLSILFQKLLFMVLLALLHIPVPLGFSIHIPSIAVTALLFLAIFLLLFVVNLRHIMLSQPATLLKGEKQGEREPRTKWVLFLVGLLALGSGYAIAILTKSPLDAIMLFFVAVVLVMIGTYALFTAGSIVLLKALRRNKAYYYKTPHFIGISGMLYRMKQNAAGLASICILSTAVLVMLSATVSMYVGMEDTLDEIYMRNVSIRMTYHADTSMETQASDAFLKSFATQNVVPQQLLSYHYLSVMAVDAPTGLVLPQTQMAGGAVDAQLHIIPLADYNAMVDGAHTLAADEIMVWSKEKEKIDAFWADTCFIGPYTFSIRERLADFPVTSNTGINFLKDGYVVVPDLETMTAMQSALSQQNKNAPTIKYYMGANAETADQEAAVVATLSDMLADAGVSADVRSENDMRTEFLGMYGGLLFLGLFLGILFLMATVLIIYYKQVSEGNEDQTRYNIMQKVGLTKEEIRSTIKSQTRVLFYLPLLAAAMHMAFAFQMITRMLSALGLMNVQLFALCSVCVILLFALLYAVIYRVTSRVYYKIVYVKPVLG